MAGPETRPELPAWRRVGLAVRRHWRPLADAIMIGVGTPVAIVAGWARPDDRGWWLLAAGACAGLGTLMGLAPGARPTGLGSAVTAGEGSGRGARAGQVWNIPEPVRTFTGRDRQLAGLREQLQTGQRLSPAPAIALYGMGGIGKTQLARAYAHRYRGGYRLGWWIPAETPLTTAAALAELAVRLGAATELPQPQQLTYAREALAERDGWLLVFDNAADPAVLEPFLPKAGAGHVVLTSRSAAWHGLADPGATEPARAAALGQDHRGTDRRPARPAGPDSSAQLRRSPNCEPAVQRDEPATSR